MVAYFPSGGSQRGQRNEEGLYPVNTYHLDRAQRQGHGFRGRLGAMLTSSTSAGFRVGLDPLSRPFHRYGRVRARMKDRAIEIAHA
jgi:hypothetical protein